MPQVYECEGFAEQQDNFTADDNPFNQMLSSSKSSFIT